MFYESFDDTTHVSMTENKRWQRVRRVWTFVSKRCDMHLYNIGRKRTRRNSGQKMRYEIYFGVKSLKRRKSTVLNGT